MGTVQQRVIASPGMTAELLPGPPATMIRKLSGESRGQIRALSSVIACFYLGQMCMPHIPPVLYFDSGIRAFW